MNKKGKLNKTNRKKKNKIINFKSRQLRKNTLTMLLKAQKSNNQYSRQLCKQANLFIIY